LGCSALLPGEPGTPEGGEYCFGPRTGREHCYATQQELGSAKSQQQQAEREAEKQRIAAYHAEEDARQEEYVRREQEKADAKARERDEVLAERHRAEDERKAQEAARAAKLHEMALDKTYAEPAISAIICSIKDEIAGLQADLVREKRVTAASGVINLRARDEAANDLVNATDEIAEWRKALKRYRAKELPCKDVAALWACRRNLETCSEQERDAAEVSMHEQAALWGSEKNRPQR
jgi:hypothetical protein